MERFPELSLFFKAYSLLDSEMICIFPYVVLSAFFCLVVFLSFLCCWACCVFVCVIRLKIIEVKAPTVIIPSSPILTIPEFSL